MGFLALDRGAEDAGEELRLEPGDDGEGLEKIVDGAMVLDDADVGGVLLESAMQPSESRSRASLPARSAMVSPRTLAW